MRDHDDGPSSNIWERMHPHTEKEGMSMMNANRMEVLEENESNENSQVQNDSQASGFGDQYLAADEPSSNSTGFIVADSIDMNSLRNNAANQLLNSMDTSPGFQGTNPMMMESFN